MYVTAALGHLLRCSSVSGRAKASGGQSHDTECPSHVSTMGCWGKKKLLVVMTSLCACAAFAFLCIAVATDYWLYAIEKVKHPNGTSTFVRTFSGLWRKCKHNAHGKDSTYLDCKYISYFTHIDRDGLRTTDAILLSMRKATLFPLISVLVLLVGGILCFLGHCNHKRKVLTFVSGILYVMGGLCTLVGIILYIGAITEETGGKKSSVSDPKFRYYYGTSFMLTVSSFIVSELTGVLSVYLYISRHKHAYQKKQERMTMLEANERPQLTRYRRSRSHSGERGREYSRDNSPAHSDSYYTYTPVSDTSKEMSNYTLPRDTSRHTISTTADTHISKDHSVHSVRDMDTLRRTTPV